MPEHLLVPQAGVGDLSIGCLHALMADLTGNAHLQGKVVGADQQGIDAVDGGDLVGILDGLRRLDHRDDEDLGVQCLLRLERRRRTIAELCRRPAGAAMPHRLKAEGVDETACLLDGIDMGHDDPQGAVVERAGALVQRAGANAHDGRHASRQGGQADLRYLLRGDRAVLGIDEQPIVSGGLGEQGHCGAAQVMHAETKRQAAATNSRERFASQHRHRFLRFNEAA